MKQSIKLLYLYPYEMNTYGDWGNVLCLLQRIKRRKINVELIEYRPGDSWPKNIDLIFMGGGQDSGQSLILEDLQAIVEDETKPVILKVIARAFIKGAEKGDFRYVSEILQHVIGKPKEQSENKHLHKIVVEYVNPTDTTLPTSSESGEDSE